jgi:hypothetical protein
MFFTSVDITFVFSSETFGGYQVILPYDEICPISENKERIVSICKNFLIADLQILKFENLVVKARNTDFHIHSYEPGDEVIKDDGSTNVIYICDHC